MSARGLAGLDPAGLRLVSAWSASVLRRVLEVPDAFSDTPSGLRQPVGAEDQDHDHQDDHQLWNTKLGHTSPVVLCHGADIRRFRGPIALVIVPCGLRNTF